MALLYCLSAVCSVAAVLLWRSTVRDPRNRPSVRVVAGLLVGSSLGLLGVAWYVEQPQEQVVVYDGGYDGI